MRKAVTEEYWALQDTQEGGYSHVPVGFTASLSGVHEVFPCLHALEVHSRFDSCGELRRAYC